MGRTGQIADSLGYEQKKLGRCSRAIRQAASQHGGLIRRSATGRRYRRPVVPWLQQVQFHSPGCDADSQGDRYKNSGRSRSLGPFSSTSTCRTLGRRAIACGCQLTKLEIVSGSNAYLLRTSSTTTLRRNWAVTREIKEDRMPRELCIGTVIAVRGRDLGVLTARTRNRHALKGEFWPAPITNSIVLSNKFGVRGE
jgi:hypothetical protein